MFTKGLIEMLKESTKEIVAMPKAVEFAVEGGKITVKGNGKENVREFSVRGISFKKVENGVEVEAKPASKKYIKSMKTIMGHISNMAKGVTDGYEYKMTVVYSHFPMNVAVKGNILEINNFTGEKKPRIANIVNGVTVAVKGKDVTLTGHNKEAVGQTAGNIEQTTRLRGKDRRIYQDGIYIVNKGKK